MRLKSRIKGILERIECYKISKKQALTFFSMKKSNHICEFSNPLSFQIIKVSTNEEYVDFCNKFNRKYSHEEAKRIKSSSVLYSICDKYIIVASGWCAYKQVFWIAESDTVINMKDADTAVLYDFETSPEYRGNGYYANLLRYITQDVSFAAEFLIYAKKENKSSCKGIKKAGFICDGDFTQSDKAYYSYLKSKGFRYMGHMYKLGGLKYSRIM